MTTVARRRSRSAGTVEWWSRTAWRLHVTLLGGWALCIAGTWVEWRRALEGHDVAGVYAVQWPLFAVMGTYVWWRLVHVEPAGRPRRTPRRRAVIAADDPQLLAWQDYVRRLEAADPPGGPPARGGITEPPR